MKRLLLALAAITLGMACGDRSASEPRSSAASSTAAAATAALRITPNPAAAGQEIRLTVTPIGGADITWGEVVRLTPTSIADASYVLIGVPPSDTEREPATYRSGEEFGATDVGHEGAGELRLLVPPSAPAGRYRLSLEVADMTRGSAVVADVATTLEVV